MHQENASVQRREDGSIDFDHYRGKASDFRSQAIFDLFRRGYRTIYRFCWSVPAASGSTGAKRVA